MRLPVRPEVLFGHARRPPPSPFHRSTGRHPDPSRPRTRPGNRTSSSRSRPVFLPWDSPSRANGAWFRLTATRSSSPVNAQPVGGAARCGSQDERFPGGAVGLNLTVLLRAVGYAACGRGRRVPPRIVFLLNLVLPRVPGSSRFPIRFLFLLRRLVPGHRAEKTPSVSARRRRESRWRPPRAPFCIEHRAVGVPRFNKLDRTWERFGHHFSRARRGLRCALPARLPGIGWAGGPRNRLPDWWQLRKLRPFRLPGPPGFNVLASVHRVRGPPGQTLRARFT